MKMLVTGGAGFIGSNFLHHLRQRYPQYQVINLDKLTYAGNAANVADLADWPGYRFAQGDILDRPLLDQLLPGVDAVVHFAAETMVDRSITGPSVFIQTNVLGTQNLLEAARQHEAQLFLQVSTDEVYGSINQGRFTEDSPLAPNSPYAASKAGADLLARSYWQTYAFPVIIIRCSNNYGPYQHPEKLIPLFVTNLIEGKKVPLYGDGLNVRDWLQVADHCSALDFVLHHGERGQVYNIGGGAEKTNWEITRAILQAFGKDDSWVKLVPDRLGHDRRYAVDCSKLNALGWQASRTFEQGIARTIDWYKEHEGWWKALKYGR